MLPSKSFTKSTAYRSPNERVKSGKGSTEKRKGNHKKQLWGMMERLREVIDEYQLKLDRCRE